MNSTEAEDDEARQQLKDAQPPASDASAEETYPIHPLLLPKHSDSATSDEVSMAAENVAGPSRQEALRAHEDDAYPMLGAYGMMGGEDTDDETTPAAGPSKAAPRGVLGSLASTLRNRPQAGDGTSPRKERSSGSRPTSRHAAGHSNSSGPSSGKHTPAIVGKATEGDYAKFLAASDLKDRLEEEEARMIARDLYLAKHPGKREKGRRSFSGGKQAALSGEALGSSPPKSRAEPTLEERGYFPGDLRHHGHLDGSRQRKSHSRRSSAHASRPTSVKELKAPAICGAVESSGSDEEARAATTLVGSALDSSDDEALDKAGPVLGGESDSESSSSLLEVVSEDRDPSTISLKSHGSDDTSGVFSLHSGGASHHLQKPLLELEELELESFLSNFGRHTREVRVPQSLTFPQRRMPRLDDFRVDPEEAVAAARRGQRVTVLTHVDRGLQRLAEDQGPGVPPSRSKQMLADTPVKLDKNSKKAREGGRAGSPHVTWATDDGYVPQSTDEGAAVFGAPEDNLEGLRQRSLEKSERAAKKEEGKAASAKARQRKEEQEAAEQEQEARAEALMSNPSAALKHDGESWELVSASEGVESSMAGEPRVDTIAFCIAYILALIERYAPEELDNSPDQSYRESKARSHVERLYIIAPFWERFLLGARRMYRWESPRRTGTAAMAYFVLWYIDGIFVAFLLILMFYIMQFRFFPPDASYLHEQVRKRMARGREADKLAERLRRRSRLDVLEIYKRWVVKFGLASQIAAGDLADGHEKIKNLILWRNPTATWRTLSIFGVVTVLVAVTPTYYIAKFLWLLLGFTFFILLPLQSHYPRYRRPLSPVWWVLWGSPTDAQFAIQLLRRRHLEKQVSKGATLQRAPSDEDGLAAAPAGAAEEMKSKSPLKMLTPQKRSSAAHAVAHGAMRPLREGEGLLSLEERVVKDGVETLKPRKLGSFFCQHNAIPGHLTITTRMIYFVALHSVRPERSHKTCKTPLEDIAGLVKTKSIRLLVWSSSGLQVQRSSKPSLFFSNMSHRDDAFNLLLAICSEHWSKKKD